MTDEKFAELVFRIEQIGQFQIESSKGKIVWRAGWKSSLKGQYQSSRDEAKRHTRNIEELLDRHKVAALMMIAIVKCSPFEKLTPVVPPRLEQARFWLAYVAGPVIFRSWILKDIEEGKDASPLEMHQCQMILPITMNGDGDYAQQTVRGLYQAHKSDRLDPFLIANILFMMDAYHRVTWQP